jgi:hypothetical protein
MMKIAILAAMKALPLLVYPKGMDPETAEQRDARFEVIATAIDKVSSMAVCEGRSESCRRVWQGSKQELAAMLVMKGWAESKFMFRVHQDKCHDDECDAHKHGNSIVHRSKSLWQVQASRAVPASEWITIGGTDLESTKRAAWAASKILAAARGRCSPGAARGWEMPTISGYATGFSCRWSKAPKRLNIYAAVAKVLVTMGNDPLPVDQPAPAPQPAPSPAAVAAMRD